MITSKAISISARTPPPIHQTVDPALPVTPLACDWFGSVPWGAAELPVDAGVGKGLGVGFTVGASVGAGAGVAIAVGDIVGVSVGSVVADGIGSDV